MEIRKENADKEVIIFTNKIAGAINRSFEEKERNEGRAESKEIKEAVKLVETPESYWTTKYCAINKGMCQGPHCFFWDKDVPFFDDDDMAHVGNCSFLSANMGIMAIASVVGLMVKEKEEERE